jgi:hypothetical protein
MMVNNVKKYRMSRPSKVVVAVLLSSFVATQSLGTTASAATATKVTWKISSLAAGQVKKLSDIASTNSPGKKTWSKSGSCTLTPKTKPTKVKMGSTGSCSLKLTVAKSGRYPLKTSKKTIISDLLTTIGPITTSPTTTVTPTTPPTTVVPVPTSFVNRTILDGLGSNIIYRMFVVGSTVYVANRGGLSISTDGGATFVTRTTADGLGNDIVTGVSVVGNKVYAGTFSGLSISTDGGATFVTRTTADGLGSNFIYEVFAVGNTVYVATNAGLSISTDGGATFVTRTTADGLGSNTINGVSVVGSTVYAATNDGLSISTDGGATFVTRPIPFVSQLNGVFAVGNTVYAGTPNVGLRISTDGGATFVDRTVSDGLGGNTVPWVIAVGNKIYAITNGGLSISS